MKSFEEVDSEIVLSGTGDWLTPELAATLATHPLDCVETEFPHVVWSADSPDERIQPSEDHPVFYGCYDWHSAVHSHWNLIRQLRLVDEHPDEAEITGSIDERLTPTNVEQEVGYFREHPTFEKPYGWAWLLRLAAELHLWNDRRADEWRETLYPLEERIVDLVESDFLTQERHFRVGTHHNSAYALTGVLDYARVVGNDSLEAAALDISTDFFAEDRDAPLAYEPLGWDFVSPSLTEADLMRRVLDEDEFRSWLDSFLPDPAEPPHDSILEPVEVGPNPDQGLALHFVGLNLSKAWCMAGIAEALGDHPYADTLQRGAVSHVEASLETAFTDNYAGSHWLASFVLYLCTRKEGAIAPG